MPDGFALSSHALVRRDKHLSPVTRPKAKKTTPARRAAKPAGRRATKPAKRQADAASTSTPEAAKAQQIGRAHV